MKKTDLPVSKKFYKDLRGRIVSSFSSFPSYQPSDILSALRAVDNYILKGEIPQEDVEPTVLLVFRLLQPEIDKALARSQRARTRARLRKPQPQVSIEPQTADEEESKRDTSETIYLTETTAALKPADTAMEPTEAEVQDKPQPILNRRMRRLIEQERKRRLKKALRG